MSAIVAELQVRRIVAEVESTGRIARVVTILVGPGGSGGGGIPLSSIGLLDGERNRGYWDAGVADYAAGDVVFESGVWLAVTPATGVSPADPAWTDISARAGLTVELGAGASASGDGSSAIGAGASASGGYSSAIGIGASASGDYSSAIGPSASASGDFSSAIGIGASASGVYSSAIGPSASASGDYSSAVGVGASASGDSSSAVGVEASASGDGDVNLAHIVTGHVDWSGSPTPDGLVLTPGFADLPVTADATDPSTDRKRLIARTDGLYVRDETGTEVGPLGAGGGGGGDVVGPASATDGAVAKFDGTTGKLLKNGSVLGTAATVDTGTGSGNAILGNDARLTDARTPTSHNHAASEITSGTIAQARLGTGSGGAGTKVLYDDQTYKTPSAGVMRYPTVSGEWYGLMGTNANSSNSHYLEATGRFTVMPIWLPAGTYDRIGITVSTGYASTWWLGAYPSDPATLRPEGQSLLFDAGTISLASNGVISASGSFSIPTDGLYYLCALCTALTSTVPYVQSFSSSLSSFFGVPWLGSGQKTSGSSRFNVGGVASGVSTGSLPATCPSLLKYDVFPQFQMRAT